MASIEISQVELLALKKLALINGALASSFADPHTAREQRALSSVLVDVINRQDIANAAEKAARTPSTQPE